MIRVKKLYIFMLKTFDDKGTLLGSSCGFFTGERGEAVSSFTPFKGASSAIVIDANGQELPVACMLGANDTYDVARFRVTAKTLEETANENLSSSDKPIAVNVGEAVRAGSSILAFVRPEAKAKLHALAEEAAAKDL